MLLRTLIDAETSTYTYLLADPASGTAALIDPVRERVERDLKLIDELGLVLRYALDTHTHADHVTGTGLLREHTGCTTVVSARGPEAADLRLPGGAKVQLGALEIELIDTPGHTDDSVSYRVGDELFTGDALLVRGNGRTDFQNGDAGALYDSITQRIFTLPDHTRIWPAHDYRGHTVSSVGEEKRCNPRLLGKTREQFIALMGALGLPPPKAIQEAVPANRELGLGGPERSSDRYRECSASELAALPRYTRVVDVREPHEWNGELGHMPRAVNIPMREVARAAKDWDREQPVLVVCRSGRRSRQVCETLADMGFTRLTNLRGGMLELRAYERENR